MPDLPTRQGVATQLSGVRILLIRTDILSGSGKEYTPGGHTGSRHRERMQMALIISVCQKPWKTDWSMLIHTEIMGSDHCPVEMVIRAGFTVSRRERGRSTGLGFKALLKSLAVERHKHGNTEN